MRNNLTGGFIFMREVYNRWMEAHGGAIVNIIADIWHGWPDFAHSGAARGGMLTLSETAACEWAASGVRVNTRGAGRHRLERLRHLRARGQGQDPASSRRPCRCSASAPRPRSSAAIVYLLSPAAAYITGTCIRVDGGTPNARGTWKLVAAQPTASHSRAFTAPRCRTCCAQSGVTRA